MKSEVPSTAGEAIGLKGEAGRSQDHGPAEAGHYVRVDCDVTVT